MIFLPIRRLYEDIGPEEKEEGVREDGPDRPGVGLAIIILLCSLLALIVIFQSYKLCRATHRHNLDLIFSMIKQYILKKNCCRKGERNEGCETSSLDSSGCEENDWEDEFSNLAVNNINLTININIETCDQKVHYLVTDEKSTKLLNVVKNVWTTNSET